MKCEKSSAGKVLGTSGAKIGNAYLKWAFSEAAVLFLAKCPQGRTLLTRLERKHGKAEGALRPRPQARSRRLLHARSQDRPSTWSAS